MIFLYINNDDKNNVFCFIRLSCPYLSSFWRIFDDNNNNDNDAKYEVSNSSEDDNDVYLVAR